MNGASACGFLLGYSPSTALHVLLFVAFATSKTVPALARNPLSDRFLCPLKESGHDINNISFREIKIILFM